MIGFAHAATEPHQAVPFWQEPETWLAVAFVIFVALLAKPVWRRATGALDARATAIAAELDEARKLREEAQATLAAYQRKQRDAQKEAEDIVHHAEEEARRITANAEAALAETLKRHEALAEERIAIAEAHAVDAVKAEAIEIALAATERLLREQLDDAGRDALVEAALKELPTKLQ